MASEKVESLLILLVEHLYVTKITYIHHKSQYVQYDFVQILIVYYVPV